MQLSCCYSLVCVFTSRRVQVYPGFPAEQSRWLPKTNTQHRTPRKYRVHLFACSNLVPCHNQAIEMCQKEARSASNKASHVRYMYLHVCIFRYLYINKINKHIYIYIDNDIDIDIDIHMYIACVLSPPPASSSSSSSCCSFYWVVGCFLSSILVTIIAFLIVLGSPSSWQVSLRRHVRKQILVTGVPPHGCHGSTVGGIGSRSSC